MVHRVYDSRNKSTSNLEHLQPSDANGIIVYPTKLLIIVHDCFTLRKALIAIIATVQLFQIPIMMAASMMLSTWTFARHFTVFRIITYYVSFGHLVLQGNFGSGLEAI